MGNHCFLFVNKILVSWRIVNKFSLKTVLLLENGAKIGNFLLENGAIIPKIALENGADCAKIHVEGDIMLYRKVQKDINNWLNEGKKALLVTGARQVGKSYLIRETLKQNNCPYIEINFIENKKAKEMFDSFVKGDTNNFLLTLKLLSEKELKKGSVIFLDEVQEVKEIVTIILMVEIQILFLIQIIIL